MDKTSLELKERLAVLISHSLSQVNVDKLNESDDEKWRLIAFMIGCVCGSTVAIDTREQRLAIVVQVVAEIFDWPIIASEKIVREAFADADGGESRVEVDAGSQSMREFELASFRLKTILEA